MTQFLEVLALMLLMVDGGDDNDACNVNQDPDGDLVIKCESQN